ncbi:MAG: dihydroneopterin aldolase [Rhodospirillaceae bacterium]|jgi:dihydroneopterin aldolase|nr:dihydroneopterin aldolase [Rhodospirillaceae bacterium]
MSKIYLVKIRRLIIDMFIGVHEHERHSRQRVAIDVELEMGYPADGFSKGIYKNVGCYETLVGNIKNLSKKGHVVLVETFADQIADIALDDRRVITASVTVEKLDVFPDCDAVGTTIKKYREKVT